MREFLSNGLDQWYETGWFCPPGTFGYIWRHFCLLELGDIIGTERVEATDAANYPAIPRPAPNQELSDLTRR